MRRRDPTRRINVQVPAQLPLVRADAALLAQLLENLLDNALRYSDRSVELQVTCDEQELQVHVMDRGEGIHPEELPKLFDSFFRGAAARGTRGSGLGLAVARAVALAHGGALQVSPRESGGSRFTLRLPAGQAPAVPMEGAA